MGGRPLRILPDSRAVCYSEQTHLSVAVPSLLPPLVESRDDRPYRPFDFSSLLRLYCANFSICGIVGLLDLPLGSSKCGGNPLTIEE